MSIQTVNKSFTTYASVRQLETKLCIIEMSIVKILMFKTDVFYCLWIYSIDNTLREGIQIENIYCSYHVKLF